MLGSIKTFFGFIFILIVLIAIYIYLGKLQYKMEEKERKEREILAKAGLKNLVKKEIYFGDPSAARIRSKSYYHYDFPIVSEGVQQNRQELVNYIITNNLRVPNPKYDDEEYWKKRKSDRPVYKYKK